MKWADTPVCVSGNCGLPVVMKCGLNAVLFFINHHFLMKLTRLAWILVYLVDPVTQSSGRNPDSGCSSSSVPLSSIFVFFCILWLFCWWWTKSGKKASKNILLHPWSDVGWGISSETSRMRVVLGCVCVCRIFLSHLHLSNIWILV